MLTCVILMLLTYGSIVCLTEPESARSVPLSIRITRTCVFTLIFMAVSVLFTGLAGWCTSISLKLIHTGFLLLVVCVKGPGKCRRRLATHVIDTLTGLISILRSFRHHPELVPAILLISIQIAWCGVFSGITPPHAWDELAYHIPASVSTVFTGSLQPAELSYPYNKYFTGSTHLLYTWMAVIGLDTHRISLMHWMLWILAGMGSYTVLRFLGISCWFALFSSVCAMACPVFIIQSLTAYVDISVAAWFSIALTFLIVWQKTQSRLALVTLACALGMLQGVKMHSFLFTLTLFAVMPVILKGQFRQILTRTHIAIVSIAIILGSYWIGYRTIQFHNPFAPLEIKIGDTILFPGHRTTGADQLTQRYRSPAENALLETQQNPLIRKGIHILFSWLELGLIDNTRIHLMSGGFGQLFTVLLLPAGIAGCISTRKIPVAIGLMFILTTLQPLSHIVRYTPVLPFVMVIPAALWLKSGGLRWVVPVLALIAVSTAGFWRPGITSNYARLFIEGPIDEIKRGDWGAGMVFFGAAVALSTIGAMCKRQHWPVMLFYPVLIITVLSAGRYPYPSTLWVFYRYSDRGALETLWEKHPLPYDPESVRQIGQVLALREKPCTSCSVVYSGSPDPPVIGLMYDRRLSRQVRWTGNSLEPFDISLVHSAESVLSGPVHK